jgi:hypothetical protein
MSVTSTLETSLVGVVVLGLRNAFPFVVEVSPRLAELLSLAARWVSRVAARTIPPSLFSEMYFRQRSSTRRALL